MREGERSLLVSIADVRDAPVTLDVAAPQIEQFLLNKKNKDAADAELARLRATAKIEYLNKDLAPDAGRAGGRRRRPMRRGRPAPPPPATRRSERRCERGVAGPEVSTSASPV